MKGRQENIVKECPVCKRLFNPWRSNQICCSQGCSKTRYELNEKSNGYTKKPKKPKSNAADIARLNEEARAHHMTYGQYVALLQMREQEEIYGSRKRQLAHD